ncbi:MAG: hypothetical protein IPJ38_23085 [Dechloromonas sp.]|uniref:Lipoprotein n=1 Tax=Candidatus Dechloromonas phosphorivorans TaxID=2899244 RepID=A0A935K160_9RHOO|nr:hypothetical protein [Candidatus Dechloromonas phosphorivorans]
MKTPILITLPALLLSACAGLGSPTADEISRLPIVRFGQPAPAGEFVLLYPAGSICRWSPKSMAVCLSNQTRRSSISRSSRIFFVYRDQVSFDGKNWHLGTDKIGSRFMFTLPGEKNGKRDAQSPGEMGAEFNLR